MGARIISNLVGAVIYAGLWYLLVLRGKEKTRKEKLKELAVNTFLWLLLFNLIPYLVEFIRK